MKFSFNCQNTYEDPALFGRSDATYPVAQKFYESDIGVKSFQDHLEMVRLADDAFDWISVSEHHAWPILQGPNAAVLLAAFAAACKRATLAWMGPLVSMNNPIRIAEEVAMLDQMTDGRLICLFLRGTPNEFLAYGVKPDETRGRTQEAIELIQAALSQPYPFAWQGRYFKYRTVSVWPGLTQKPMVPIISSGNSTESVTYAAKNRHGLGISFYPPNMVADLVAFYYSECKRFGWEPDPDWIVYRAFAAVAADDDEARDREERFYGSKTGVFMPFTGRGQQVVGELKLPEAPTRIDGDQKDDGVRGFALGQLAFVGSAATVVDQIKKFTDMTGVGVVDIAFNGGGLTAEEAFDALRRFAEDVIPPLRDLDEPTSGKEAMSVGC